MFRTILVAYDGSTFAAAALREAGDLAHLCKAELHLLGIVATTGFMALAEGTGSMDVWGMERQNLTTAQDAANQTIGTGKAAGGPGGWRSACRALAIAPCKSNRLKGFEMTMASSRIWVSARAFPVT